MTTALLLENGNISHQQIANQLPTVNVNDAPGSGSMFLNEELTHTDPITIEPVYTALKSPRIFPVDTTGGWSQFFQYSMLDAFGQADLIECCGEIPTVGFTRHTGFSSAVTLASGAKWCFTDEHYGQQANLNFRATQRRLAERAIYELLEHLIWHGRTDRNVMGILNNPIIPRVSFPKTLNNLHPTEILAQINFMIANTIAITGGSAAPPDTLLLPPSLYSQLASLPIGVNLDKILLTEIIRTSLSLRRVDWIPELETAGRGGRPIAVAFANDPSVIKVKIPVDIQQSREDDNGMHTSLFWYMRFGGVQVYDPTRIIIIDNIFNGGGGCNTICPTTSFPISVRSDCETPVDPIDDVAP